LEISTLVRHGYCVGRKACRARPDLFGAELPGNAPWDPVPDARGVPPSVPPATRTSLLPTSLRGRGAKGEPTAATVEARALQGSAPRRIWSTLWDSRDWISYLYVPIIVPILILLPYFVGRLYQRVHRDSKLAESLSQGSPDYDVMSSLLESPIKPWDGEPAEEV